MGEVVIIGAGIIGLWTALLLVEQGLGPKIKVIAKNLPGDLSVDYTSPIAGAHFSCSIVGESEEALRHCTNSYKLLRQFFQKFKGRYEELGIDLLPQIELFVDKPAENVLDKLPGMVDDFEEITDKAWLNARGGNFGIKYTTFNFYSPKFIKFLQKYLEEAGVTFKRVPLLKHISEAPAHASVSNPSAVFNCTGVLAGRLGGVHDPQETYPIRGQVVIVRAPWVKENLSIYRQDVPPTYIIPRVHSGGRVILGGYYDKNDWSEGTRVDQTASILARTTQLNPDLLKHGELEVLDERAGLRPGRDGGARIEREQIGSLNVIHNYGAAGTGFQCGLSMASDAVKLYLANSSKL